MQRNAPLFVLLLGMFTALSGLSVWSVQGCIPDASGWVCTNWLLFPGLVLLVAGVALIVAGVFLELQRTRGQPPLDALPLLPLCPVCGKPLLYVADYELWYCATCRRYAVPGVAGSVPARV